MTTAVWFWLILGLSLIGAEFLVPGLVVVFLGFAALLVAGSVALGWTPHWIHQGTLWFTSSLALIVALRRAVTRVFPPETVVARVEEDDSDLYGEIVEVVEAISPDHEQGRIALRGAGWAATSIQHPLAVGTRAKLVYRENLVWVVEPATPLLASSIDDALDGRRT